MVKNIVKNLIKNLVKKMIINQIKSKKFLKINKYI